MFKTLIVYVVMVFVAPSPNATDVSADFDIYTPKTENSQSTNMSMRAATTYESLHAESSAEAIKTNGLVSESSIITTPYPTLESCLAATKTDKYRTSGKNVHLGCVEKKLYISGDTELTEGDKKFLPKPINVPQFIAVTNHTR